MVLYSIVVVLFIASQQGLSARGRLVLSLERLNPITINIDAILGTRYQGLKHSALRVVPADKGEEPSIETPMLVNTVNQKTIDNYALQKNGEGASLPYQLPAVDSISIHTLEGHKINALLDRTESIVAAVQLGGAGAYFAKKLIRTNYQRLQQEGNALCNNRPNNGPSLKIEHI